MNISKASGKKSSGAVRRALTLLVAVIMLAGSLSAPLFFAEDYVPREGDFEEPRSGNVIMGITGEFVTVDEAAKEVLLARVNEIRMEACTEGVPSPSDREVPLTPDDYVEIKWSGLTELVAAMRAAEASVLLEHKRLGVEGTTYVFTHNYGVRTNGENLAWNFNSPSVDAILYGINQWYGEKADWVAGTEGAVTGHYTSMINPKMKYIGLSGFYNSSAKYPMCVTNHLSMSSGLDEAVAGIGGKVIQKTEVDPAYITSLELTGKAMMTPGEVQELANTATLVRSSSLGNSTGKGPLYTGLTYESSDESVVTVDANGCVTAVDNGTATVTATLNENVSASIEITVSAAHDPSIRISSAFLSLADDLSISFKVPKAPFTGESPVASDPYLTVRFNDNDYTLTDCTDNGTHYVFCFDNIGPQYMSDKLTVKLYATVSGGSEPELIQVLDYSVVKYCTNMLNRYGGVEGYETLCKLLVDTLNYGAAAQNYVNYNTANLANGTLTPEQKAMGTQGGLVSLHNAINDSYVTVSSPEVIWETSSVLLDKGLTIKLKVSAEDITGLRLNGTDKGELDRSVPASEFVDAGNGQYYVYFTNINPSMIGTILYFNFTRDGETVSNTLRFSIDSYVYQLFDDSATTPELRNLLFMLMYYGASASEYVAG